MTNLVVFDWDAEKDTLFTKGVSEASGEKYNKIGVKQGKLFYLRSFFLVMRLFFTRRKYNKIIFWQQRHGIWFAFLCSLFHVEKCNRIMVLTFIFKEVPGIKGKIKKKLFDIAIGSKYIDLAICYSKKECDYYSELFHQPREKFMAAIYGIKDEIDKFDTKIDDEKCVVAAGCSNRDYDFLVNALDGTNYNVKIIDRTCQIKDTSNIKILKDVTYGDELYSLISKAVTVVVPLKDQNISSGQTVIEQAMMFGKPVIVTESKAVLEYLIDGENGYIIKKDKNQLLEKLNQLCSDDKLYFDMSKSARRFYEDNFSLNLLGRRIAEFAKMM